MKSASAAAISAFALLIAAVLSLGHAPAAAAAEDGQASAIEKGKAVALHRQKGNCLSCHWIEGEEQPGNVGPPLVNMQARYPDKSELRAQIWDMRIVDPGTIMPPFGAHGVLTPEEVDLVTEYIYSL